jgi:hypothetical protein
VLKNVASGARPGRNGEAYLYVALFRTKNRAGSSLFHILVEIADIGARRPSPPGESRVEGARHRWKALWFDETVVL